jgi:S1-C subfamily serine protease
VGVVVSAVTQALSEREAPLSFQANAQAPAPRGDMRSFNASLGTIPDYAGPGPGKQGVLLSGVRPGSAAEKAGLRRGDIIIKIGRYDVRSLEDFMFVLNASHPGETTRTTILRDGKPLSLDVTFEARAR